MPRVFLSYCRENEEAVKQLYGDLVNAGFEVWWDRDIHCGQDWRLKIDSAIKDCIAVVACFSKQFVERSESWMWNELHTAIEYYRCLPPGTAFIFPVRLSDCVIPDMFITSTLCLSQLQYADLFPEDKRPFGLKNLIKSLSSADTLKVASDSDHNIDKLEKNSDDSQWLQFRHAMIRKHGHFSDWPKNWRDRFASSSRIRTKLFVAEMYDLERRYSEAVKTCENILKSEPIKAFESGVHVTLALFLEHLGDFSKEKDVLQKFLSLCNDSKIRSIQYWRAKYHLGITSRNLAQYKNSNFILKEVECQARTDDLRIAALHQRGVTLLELGNYDAAIEIFKECNKRRSNDNWNRRRAYEHRRLGQAFAFANKQERAEQEFEDAIEISTRCRDVHYIAKSKSDLETFVSIPNLLQSLSYPDCLRPDPDADLNDSFRVLSSRRKGYLPLFDETTSKPTGEVSRWEVVHEKGLWHSVVMLLIVNSEAEFAVQRREEDDSDGKLDVAVAGHLEVGETDELAVLREAYEELRIFLDGNMLYRFGKPFGFRKKGLPSVNEDKHLSATEFVYPTTKTNRELVSVFLARCDAVPDSKRLTWLSCLDAHEIAIKEPMEYASAFRHLFGTKTMSERVNQRIKQML